VHIRTREWRKLPKEVRDKRLLSLGISSASLSKVRAEEPRKRLVAAARLALSIDQTANSDFIEFIAGYNSGASLFHHFATMSELLEQVSDGIRIRELDPITTTPDEIDLAKFIPKTFRGYPVCVESVADTRLHVWQKVPGGIREATINRRILRLLFLSGVLLYTTEGSKYTRGNNDVQFSNATPGTHRLFLEFLEAIGVPRALVKARIQLHDAEDWNQAQQYWNDELGLDNNQYYKPMMSPAGTAPRRHTFTLHLKYNNSMLACLLTEWGSDPQKLYAGLTRT